MVKTVRFQNGEEGDVLFAELIHEETDAEYRKRILKKGMTFMENGLPLSCDVIEEKNVPVTLRDGTVMYTDIYRPQTEEKCPAIIAWSPYGKENRGRPMPYVALSGLQKFEGPDPAYWTAAGYAVLNPDARGIGAGEGEFHQWGLQQAEDGYDFVEWTAANDWCSGSVAFAGTSYLAISQWFIASLNPPHLTCIAPWEGFSDAWSQSQCAGGIPDYEFEKCLFYKNFRGLREGEQMGEMCEQQPLFSSYWDDKRARIENIQVPVYVVASYTNKVHTRGTLDSYRDCASEAKWLRIHNTHEWHDFYTHQDDLRRFFDFYMKNEENGWNTTPPVRMAVLNPGGDDLQRELSAYPFEGNAVKQFYLDAKDHAIREDCPEQTGEVSYTSDPEDPGVSFSLTFSEKTEIVGKMSLELELASETAEDADLFIQAEKLDAEGKVLPVPVKGAPYAKPGEAASFEWGNGRQRVSLRDGKTPVPMVPGEHVQVTVSLCPMGMLFEAGQQLRITVYSHDFAKPELPGLAPIRTVNEGNYHIYTGKGQSSSLFIPCL